MCVLRTHRHNADHPRYHRDRDTTTTDHPRKLTPQYFWGSAGAPVRGSLGRALLTLGNPGQHRAEEGVAVDGDDRASASPAQCLLAGVVGPGDRFVELVVVEGIRQ